jgi:hypothetical protein
MVCSATGLAACSTCPYQVPGVVTQIPEDDGTVKTRYCPHTAEFLADPANLAAVAAAQAAAAQQQQAAAIAAQQAAAQAAIEAQQEAIRQQQAAQQAQEQINSQN